NDRVKDACRVRLRENRHPCILYACGITVNGRVCGTPEQPSTPGCQTMPVHDATPYSGRWARCCSMALVLISRPSRYTVWQPRAIRSATLVCVRVVSRRARPCLRLNPSALRVDEDTRANP